jgi:PIN domain nuclease of toxin-antitoxin system
MTNALLDTHVVLWATLAPDQLSRAAREIIADEQNVLYVSSVSAWEIANKVRIGKLPEAEGLEADFLEYMDEAGFTLLPVDVDVALRAGRLPGEHRDPWDRMISAQALALDIPVLSLDTKLDAFGVRRIW